MIQQKNYNVGDFVKDKLGNEWEVLRYKEVFGLGLSMQKTDFVVCLKSATPFPKCYLHKEKWTFDS